MPTLKDFADKYVVRLRRAEDKEAEVDLIAAEINRLVSPTSKRSIPEADKLEIVSLMQQELLVVEARGLRKGSFLKEAENKHYLALAEYLIKLITS